MTTVTEERTNDQGVTASSPASTSTPDFIVLGEAPGRIEDDRGVPFIGPAGQLFRKVLRELDIEHRAVYMNTVSCWPVGEPNSKPTTDQKQACRDNLRDQLGVINAAYVLACGQVATQAMIRHSTAATMGHLVKIHEKLVYPIYHPAYILHKKDPELYLQWKTDLGRFMMLMGFGVTEDDRETCYYCKNPKYSSLPTCYKHRENWRKDQVWDQKSPRRIKGKPLLGQGNMFE